MRFRTDAVPEENMHGAQCPDFGGELTEARKFNLMFTTAWVPWRRGGLIT